MATIDINSLPLKTSMDLSDLFEVYNLSGDRMYCQTIKMSDLSGFFFSGDSFTALSAKYDELIQKMDSFMDFVRKTYPTSAAIPELLTTKEHLSQVIAELQTIDTVKMEILNDYATLDFEDLMKARAYKNHEMLAEGLGSMRSAILGSVSLEDADEGDE